MTVDWARLDAEDTDIALITAYPADSPPVIAGAVQHMCEQCGRTVWLAPSTLEFMANLPPPHKEAIVACIPCVLRHKPDVFDEEPIRLPKAREEVIAAIHERRRIRRQRHGH